MHRELNPRGKIPYPEEAEVNLACECASVDFIQDYSAIDIESEEKKVITSIDNRPSLCLLWRERY